MIYVWLSIVALWIIVLINRHELSRLQSEVSKLRNK